MSGHTGSAWLPLGRLGLVLADLALRNAQHPGLDSFLADQQRRPNVAVVGVLDADRPNAEPAAQRHERHQALALHLPFQLWQAAKAGIDEVQVALAGRVGELQEEEVGPPGLVRVRPEVVGLARSTDLANIRLLARHLESVRGCESSEGAQVTRLRAREIFARDDFKRHHIFGFLAMRGGGWLAGLAGCGATHGRCSVQRSTDHLTQEGVALRGASGTTNRCRSLLSSRPALSYSCCA